ncbi:unnamed protein product, partial [Heterosigma akashiwo]
RWVHQVCALFNSRKNSSDQNVYFCPWCTIQAAGGEPHRAHGQEGLRDGPAGLQAEQARAGARGAHARA